MNAQHMPQCIFTKVILDCGPDLRARFREEKIILTEIKPKLFFSDLVPSGGFQIRHSPPGYFMDFHLTTNPAWMFMLSGALEISLRDGTARVFRAGDHLYSEDMLPPGVAFDPEVHGHRARQVGAQAVVAAFARG